MFKDASKSISTYLIPVLCVLYIQFPILRILIILHMIPISIIGVANAVIQERTPLLCYFFVVKGFCSFHTIGFSKFIDC